MIALYIVIGIAVGAVVLYLVMNQKVGRLHVELAKKETEMQMLSQQRSEEQRQSEERFAEQMRSQREQAADQLRAQREQSTEQLKAAREQFDEQLKTTKEQAPRDGTAVDGRTGTAVEGGEQGEYGYYHPAAEGCHQ